MPFDLRSGLHALHDEVHRTGVGLPVPALVARARRRRALVRTGYGAVGAGTVAALVVGGTAMAGLWRQDAAPVAETPTPTPPPSPSAGPSPVSTPSPSQPPFAPDLALCGTTVPTFDDSQAMSVYGGDYVEPALGAPIQLSLQVSVPEDWGGETVSVGALTGALTEIDDTTLEATVVGVPAAPLPPAADQTLDRASSEGVPGAATWLTLTTPFVMCDGTPGAGGPPHAGEYVVLFQVSMVHAGETRTQWGGSAVAVDGVIDAAAPPAATPPDDPARTVLPAGTPRIGPLMDQSSCGLPPSDVGATAEAWTVEPTTVTAEATAERDTSGVVVSMRLRGAGAGLDGALVRYPSFFLVGDGALVGFGSGARVMAAGNLGGPVIAGSGWAQSSAVSWTAVPSWPAGVGVDVGTDVGPYTCTFAGGQTWPSGTYQVYPFTEITLADGSTQTVRAPAVTLTVP